MTTDAAERSTNKKRDWKIWVGSQEDLHRLAAMIESLAKQRRETLIAELRVKSDRERKEGNQDEWSLKYAEQVSQREIELVEDYYRLTVIGEDGDDTTKGEFEIVLNEVDRRTVKSITFQVGRYRDNIEVTFKRAGYGAGVSLAVSSPDQGWAKRSYIELSDEIAKGVPHYSWIHANRGHGIIGLGSSFLIVLTVVLVVLPALPSKDRGGAWVFSIFVFVWLSLPLIASSRPYEWLAPHFELVGQDVQSTGSRRIGTIAGLIGAVIIGIIVNRIYS